MPYNWDGDLILQDTKMEDKRFVIRHEDRAVSADVREWMSFEDNIIMKDIIRDLQKKAKLPTGKDPGDFDRRARAIWAFVATSVTYEYDDAEGKADFWMFPPEVHTLAKGDCEDTSFLLASLLIACGVSPFCVRVALGEVFDEKGASLGGHCWPVYKNESGRWCILESTLDQVPSRLPEADPLTRPGQAFQYVPYYCFNNHHLWAILPDPTLSKKPDALPSYLQQRGKKVNMRETRLASGGWLSHITGDWEPGHLEYTEKALKTRRFDADAIDVAADASQDPDFYDWNTAWVHAQTENDADGKTSQKRNAAIKSYLNGVERLHKGMMAVAGTSPRAGLFLLGYIIHAVQDLGAHQGITNAQHSYVSKMLGSANDPDHNPDHRKKAQEFTAQYLDFVKSSCRPTYNQLFAYKGRLLPWDKLLVPEKTAVLNQALGTHKIAWDLTPKAVLDYSALKDKYAKIKDKYRVEDTQWDVGKVFADLLHWLGS